MELVSVDLKNNWHVFSAVMNDDTTMSDIIKASEMIQPLPKCPPLHYEMRLVSWPCDDEFGSRLRGQAKYLGGNATVRDILDTDYFRNFRLRAPFLSRIEVI